MRIDELVVRDDSMNMASVARVKFLRESPNYNAREEADASFQLSRQRAERRLDVARILRARELEAALLERLGAETIASCDTCQVLGIIGDGMIKGELALFELKQLWAYDHSTATSSIYCDDCFDKE